MSGPRRLRVEVPRGAFIKRDEHGQVEFLSPLPCPFAYGSVIGTSADDGDALDAVILGAAPRLGAELEARQVGRVPFVDDGVLDDKLVFWAPTAGGPSAADRRLVAVFFWAYAIAKRARARVNGSRAPTTAGRPEWWSADGPRPERA